MTADILEEIERLRELAGERGVQVHEIVPDGIVVSQWVRFKCRYGCRGYGKHFGCPPYAPSPDETRRMVDEYSRVSCSGSTGFRVAGSSGRMRFPTISTHGMPI